MLIVDWQECSTMGQFCHKNLGQNKLMGRGDIQGRPLILVVTVAQTIYAITNDDSAPSRG